MPRDHRGLVQLIAREVRDERVVDAFRRIDRAGFVPEDRRREAYGNRPVLLPLDQTTSQPTLIATMVVAVAPQPDSKILEIGTGYGYQTAALAVLAREVVSIERHEALAVAARANLERAGLDNATVVVGDGWEGWEPKAPYDGIVVSAAAASLPEALGEQLAEGGRLVIPVTTRGSDDVLLFEKHDGALQEIRLITPARFVPLVKGPDAPQ
ncbi:MAG: protein-L-isoaspartate(D-aspartate) O-methyltransferase [Actinomycetota bacterium]